MPPVSHPGRGTLLDSPRRPPRRPQRGVTPFVHGEAILLAPLFPHSPFSDLREGVTTPIEIFWFSLNDLR
jgi:hypothetical protein